MKEYTLYFGNLSSYADECFVKSLFDKHGYNQFKLSRDHRMGISYGYGYVTYSSYVEAEAALNDLRYTPVNGVPMRVMWANKKFGEGHVIVRGISPESSEKDLFKLFSNVVPVYSCRIVRGPGGHYVGHGFVSFEKKEDEEKVISILNGTEFNGSIIQVEPNVGHRLHRNELKNEVFVKNISPDASDDELLALFRSIAPIEHYTLKKTEGSPSHIVYGFIQYKTEKDVNDAIERLNGVMNRECKLFVDKSFGKDKFKIEKYKSIKSNSLSTGFNVMISSVNASETTFTFMDKLSKYGPILSLKLVPNRDESSTQLAKVCCATEETQNLILNHMVGSAPLPSEFSSITQIPYLYKKFAHAVAFSAAVNLPSSSLDLHSKFWVEKFPKHVRHFAHISFNVGFSEDPKSV